MLGWVAKGCRKVKWRWVEGILEWRWGFSGLGWVGVGGGGRPLSYPNPLLGLTALHGILKLVLLILLMQLRLAPLCRGLALFPEEIPGLLNFGTEHGVDHAGLLPSPIQHWIPTQPCCTCTE